MAFIDLEATFNFWKDFFGSILQKKSPIVSPPIVTTEIIHPSVVANTQPDPNDTFTTFDPGLIITDKEFCDCDSMSEQQIQDFFVKWKGVILPTYEINGHLISYWVAKHSKDNGINPKIIICNLQKEQAAVTASKPFKKQRTYDYICGVGATDGGDNPKWAGMDKQILGAIQTNAKWQQAGLKKNFPMPLQASDKADLIVKNAATYSLYKYTPWVGNQDKQIGKNLYQSPFGNYLFWKVYKKFFK
jgi:hypothetical protein